jgi:cytochrome c
VLLVVFELLALFVHPFGNVRTSSTDKPVMKAAYIEQPVLDVMQRSCQNCHSERTEWPWYSRFAPISWGIEKDVHDGRSHWDMSRWDQYSSEERQDILSQMAPMVRNRKMPLPKYLLLHPEAKLSDADVELLYQWSRGERKRIKSESSKVSNTFAK